MSETLVYKQIINGDFQEAIGMSSKDPTKVLVQFNNTRLIKTEKGIEELPHEPEYFQDNLLGFGWHEFSKDDFIKYEPVEY
jgi:transcription initiation factor IIE alpha subunit